MNMNAQIPDSKAFIRHVSAREEAILHELRVKERILEHAQTPEGLSRFAAGFYFIRVNFVRLNFILGARCPNHELYWSGLALNLMEELGGEKGPTHNELYRWFLQAAGIPNEENLLCPSFAAAFDEEWDSYCRETPLLEALGAIAVYEIFDNPDYRMLLEAMQGAGVGERGLIFFRVHAKAEHFELFEKFFEHANQTPAGVSALHRATEFVVNAQRKMWSNLLEWMEQHQDFLLPVPALQAH